MPLHMTKIAYRSGRLENLRKWVEAGEEAHMTTRYLPKRHEEMIGGSLYWILEHAIVARSEIIGFFTWAFIHSTGSSASDRTISLRGRSAQNGH